jgi:hypothetical protein
MSATRTFELPSLRCMRNRRLTRSIAALAFGAWSRTSRPGCGTDIDVLVREGNAVRPYWTGAPPAVTAAEPVAAPAAVAVPPARAAETGLRLQLRHDSVGMTGALVRSVMPALDFERRVGGELRHAHGSSSVRHLYLIAGVSSMGAISILGTISVLGTISILDGHMLPIRLGVGPSLDSS